MGSVFQSLPLLRRAAPRLSRQFFTCTARVSRISNGPSVSSATRPLLQAFHRRPIVQALRFQSGQTPKHVSSLGTIGKSVSGNSGAGAKKAFPETSDKIVAYWLLGSAASVFGIVVLGGLTRLTESGLSITEWRPVTGSLPPMNRQDWESEFAKYRLSPEFKQLNSNMDLDDFKKIYWYEWTHRLWGRVIGVTFLLPTIYFIAKRRVTKPMAWALTGICGGIGFQGVIGWWMVKSGLHDDLFAPGAHPRVSQYRLTTHLCAAFVVYTAMVLSGLSILREHRMLKNPAAAQKIFETLRHPHLRLLRGSVTGLAALVFITAMSGALVAGLDAGLIYNEFPYMGTGLAPPAKELWDPFYSHREDQSDLWWRNMLENPSLVQLNHRILACTTFTAICALFYYSRFSPRVRAIIPANVKRGVTGTLHVSILQVTLGISTLLYLVPTWLAAAHQAGSLALLTTFLVLGSRLRMPKRTAMLIAKRLGKQNAILPRGKGIAAGSVEQTRA